MLPTITFNMVILCAPILTQNINFQSDRKRILPYRLWTTAFELTSKPLSYRRNESITVFVSVCSTVEKPEVVSKHSSILFTNKKKREICV